MKVTGKRVLLVIAAVVALGVGGLILHMRSPKYRVANVLQQIREPAGEREIGRVRQWLIGLHLAGAPESLTHDEAVWDLVQLGPPAVPLLIAALDDPDIAVRLVAIDALGWLGDSRAVEPLMGMLDAPRQERMILDDGDGPFVMVSGPRGVPTVDVAWDERAHVACTLGRLGDPRAAPKLARLLAESTPRMWAPLTYEELDTGRDDLVDPRNPGDGRIVRYLATVSQAGLFAPAIWREGTPVHAARALVLLGPPAVPHVAPLLNSEERLVSANAACVLGTVGGPEAAEALTDRMASPLILFDDEAAEALMHIGPDAVGPLVRRLKDRNVEPARRGRIALLLGQMKDPAAVDALMEASLRDADQSVRAAADGALTTMAVEAVDRVLQRWLVAGEVPARTLAVRVLGESGHLRAVAPLAKLLDDPDPAVRAESAYALGTLPSWRDLRDGLANRWQIQEAVRKHLPAERAGVAEIFAAMEDEKETRASLPAVLATVRDHLPAIRGLLEDEHARVREAAARAVGILDDAEGVEALIRLMKDADDEVRVAAAGSLGSLKDPKAVGPLCGLLLDTSVAREKARLAVVAALAEIGDERAVESIRQAMTSGSGDFRHQCVRAIRDIGGSAAVDALAGVLSDPFEWAVTSAVVTGLEDIGDERAIGPLEALARREPDMRSDVERAIHLIRARAAETRPAS